MKEDSDDIIFNGRPMLPEDLNEGDSKVIDLPSGCKIVSIEDARSTLKQNVNHIYTLQAFQDDVEDLTEELDYLLDKYEVTHPFVVEIADYLAIQVKQWQSITQTIEQNGARIASLDPARLEWYGVVDGKVALYSWQEGESDIEWYHAIDSGFPFRKPLIEA